MEKQPLSHKMCRGLLLFEVLCGMLMLCFTGCAKEPENQRITESEAAQVIEEFLAPQINEYKKAFQVDDLSVEVQIKTFKMIGDTHVSCGIRDIILSPTLSGHLRDGTFTEEMLRQLSTIEFEYEEMEHNGFSIRASSCLLYPIIRDEDGNEYTVSEDVLLKGDTIAYISPDAELTAPASVGDDINSFGSQGSTGNSSAGSRPTGEKCPVCNGTGYVKYYYGDSDLQAYLDGYDPYTVGECTSCNGTGRR